MLEGKNEKHTEDSSVELKDFNTSIKRTVFPNGRIRYRVLFENPSQKLEVWVMKPHEAPGNLVLEKIWFLKGTHAIKKSYTQEKWQEKWFDGTVKAVQHLHSEDFSHTAIHHV